MYDNDLGVYVELKWIDRSRWYGRFGGYIWIVPPLDVVAEIEGPDTPMLDALIVICRQHRWPTDDELRRLNLVEIPPVLWRFHPLDGYYHA